MDRSRPTAELLAEVMAGEVLCDIGQVGKDTVRQLKKLVKAGTVLKWRGKWYPVAGAAFGMGPDKTCWSLAAKYGAAS